MAERMATGGEAVARLDDGRVVFVAGALAGERVRVAIDSQKKRFAKAHVTEVLRASHERRDPPCPHVISGQCGGCDWQHISPAQQRAYKTGIAREQLARRGGIAEPNVRHHADPPGLRTTVRCVVTNDRAGYRQRRSHKGFDAGSCDAAHELLRPLIIDGRYPGVDEVTLRASAASGERMAIVSGDRQAAPGVRVPDDVEVIADSDPGDAAITEEVCGVSFRVSAKSFFQTSPQCAATLVAAVREMLAEAQGPLVDLYGGVGLLGIAACGAQLHTIVESSPAAVLDARHNLTTLDPDHEVAVVESRVERWQPELAYGAVIADPARSGLRAEGVSVIGATGASELALVSCDAGALGRDAGLLIADGWTHTESVVVDMFPDTSQLEVASHFSRH